MSNEYKQCPNGHYYQGDHCPYCRPGNSAPGNNTSSETMVFGNQDGQQPTETMPGMGNKTTNGEKTTMFDGETMMGGPGVRQNPGAARASMSGSTIFGEEDEVERVSTPNGERIQRVFREARKIVGWLVSYTLDPLGVDFKLYEGRNIIGRDMDCNITVNDNMVSSKHAVLLFRAGKYSITDSQSSHGTFVNNTDIDLDPYYLQDGDIIKMGQTTFKFRTSF